MRQVTKRMIILFLAFFVVTSIGDVWTTELGRRLPNTVELNPLGFMPLHQSILIELAICVVGCLIVAAGAWMSVDTLAVARTSDFLTFLRQAASSYSFLLLVFAPIQIAALRVLAIINNASNLTVGWSPLNRYLLEPIASLTGLSAAQSLCVMLALMGGFAAVPTIGLIHRVASYQPARAE